MPGSTPPDNQISHPQDSAWWRHAVTYQIYPRSFADGNNDGTGDLVGITSRLGYLADLGVDAIWISPWYPSPLVDGGYDIVDYRDIDPRFGTLRDAEQLLARAHELGLRVFIDLVPNHSSDLHPRFQAALAAGPGSPEREWYVFRDGRGTDGALPPTNWGSMFGGPAWRRVTEPDGRPGQWYLHMFAPEQPDWNWDNPLVREEFDSILRFWFDRGVDGFRVDVADALVKDLTLHDVEVDPLTGYGTTQKYVGHPWWDQPGLADVQRRWRAIAEEYADSPEGARAFVAEAYLPAERLAPFASDGRLNLTFDFGFLESAFDAASLRSVIDRGLSSRRAAHTPSVWVLENHDVIRSVSRYGKVHSGRTMSVTGPADEDPHWQERMADDPTDVALGRRRARAMALLLLSLPGDAFVYQGEELGLEEVEDLPEDVLDDPIWTRSKHTLRGRDGCRVPIPWSGDAAPFGFSAGAEPWLPQPESWAGLTCEREQADPDSMLSLYRTLLRIRHEHPALGEGTGTIAWEDAAPDVLCFTRDPGFRCVVNLGRTAIPLPQGRVVAASLPLDSDALDSGMLPSDAAAWIVAD